jgi:hypothetical protein
VIWVWWRGWLGTCCLFRVFGKHVSGHKNAPTTPNLFGHAVKPRSKRARPRAPLAVCVDGPALENHGHRHVRQPLRLGRLARH